MATFKHVASKNADYAAAERYLTYQHDEYTNQPVRDENGRLVLREKYLLDTLECGNESFAMACLRTNQQFNKNNKSSDVKSHHYIISFDPRDAEDHALTMERAQQLGIEFCKKNFPGHQAIIATHPDGHNGAGNIHVHIVINSVRGREIEREPWMEKPSDWKAGCKHRVTRAHLHYLQTAVMEMCQKEGLYQIDLHSHEKDERITEAEYWAQRRGQEKLNQKNEQLTACGERPTATQFQTDLQVLRDQIRKCMEEAKSYEEFQQLLLKQYNVKLKESRGRYSFLPPGRTQYITARRLGDAFSKEKILAVLEKNAVKAEEDLRWQTDPDLIWAVSVRFSPEADRKIGHLINIQKKIDEGKGGAYINWAKLHNLKQMAESLYYLRQQGVGSMKDLGSAISAAETNVKNCKKLLQDLDRKIDAHNETGEAVIWWNQYHQIAEEYRGIPEKYRFRKKKGEEEAQKFYNDHQTELVYFEAAESILHRHGYKKAPGISKFTAAGCELEDSRAEAKEEYRQACQHLETMKRACHNLDWTIPRLSLPWEEVREQNVQELDAAEEQKQESERAARSEQAPERKKKKARDYSR